MTRLTAATIAFVLVAVTQQPEGSASAVTKLASSVSIFASSLGSDHPADSSRRHRDR